ncbi:MAG: phosphate ABC transporter substrate-binding protein PstS, partial [Candidatus Acidiferrum sp.]
MTHPQTSFFSPSRKMLPNFIVLPMLILLALAASAACAQSAESLFSVKYIYIDSFGQQDSASKLRERLIKQLRKSGRVQVVATPAEADALVKGTESMWVVGYYSTDARSPSATRQPILHGYLSVDVQGKDHQPLCSYLVTPRKFRTGSLSQDLADQLAAKLLAALTSAKPLAAASPAATRPLKINLTGAGATFPAPLYQKWFESFQQRHPDAHITYNAVGSEAGIHLISDGEVDFAASDMPLSSTTVPDSPASFLHFPTVLGAVVPIYNLGALDRPLKLTPEVLAEIYLGKITKWNDPKIRASNHGADLPSSDIAVLHRSDGSGTTFV